MCLMLHVTFHLSLTPTATATDFLLANAPTVTVGWFGKTKKNHLVQNAKKIHQFLPRI